MTYPANFKLTKEGYTGNHHHSTIQIDNYRQEVDLYKKLGLIEFDWREGASLRLVDVEREVRP